MGKKRSGLSLRIAITFLILGSLWILFSDWLIYVAAGEDGSRREWLSIFKGWFFVFVTAAVLYLLIDRGVHMVEASEEALAKNEQRFQLLARNSRDMIYLYRFKPRFEFDYVSPAAMELTGYAPEEFYRDSSKFFGLFSNEDRMEFVSSWKNLSNHKITQTLCWTRKDGSTLWIEHNTAPIYDKTGAVVAIQGVVHDISERIRQEAEIARQKLEIAGYAAQVEEINQQLEEAKRLKSEFLSNTSHELRTPLNAIIGFLTIIKDGLCESREEEVAFIERALNSSRQLLRMVNDILDMAKLEADNLFLICSPVQVKALMGELEAMTRVEAATKRLGVNFEPVDETLWVAADLERLEQVCLKLVQNAIKFTHQGTITVSARREGECCRISIVDTGIGIAPDDLKRLFQNFVQADGSVSRKYGGMGLGLAISRALIEKMGGTLTLDSRGIGQGTAAYLILPLADR